jgi:hypothetical protein
VDGGESYGRQGWQSAGGSAFLPPPADGERVELVGLTREVDTPLPSNSPYDHMILRVDLVGSHGRWKRPCLQTAHMTLCY